MVIGNLMNLPNLETIVISVVLAFVFGYSLTLLPLLKTFSPGKALKLALAADTLSITIMEIVDNLIMLAIPGAMEAGPASGHFWLSMVVSLVLAGLAAFPVNRWLISRGRGHAAVHKLHVSGGGGFQANQDSAGQMDSGDQHKHLHH